MLLAAVPCLELFNQRRLGGGGHQGPGHFRGARGEIVLQDGQGDVIAATLLCSLGQDGGQFFRQGGDALLANNLQVVLPNLQKIFIGSERVGVAVGREQYQRGQRPVGHPRGTKILPRFRLAQGGRLVGNQAIVGGQRARGRPLGGDAQDLTVAELQVE